MLFKRNVFAINNTKRYFLHKIFNKSQKKTALKILILGKMCMAKKASKVGRS